MAPAPRSWLALALVTLLALVLAADGVSASDCTSAQIAEVTSLTSNATSACGSDALSLTATAATYCSSSCLAYMTSVASTAPNCEIEGYNVRTTLSSAISLCDSQSDAVPAAKSAASPSPRAAGWSLALAIVAANALAAALAH